MTRAGLLWTKGDVPTYERCMTTNKTRPYTVILNGRSTHHGKTLALYQKTHTFRHQQAAYGCALDFVLHGPKDNVALVRLNGKAFMRIEKVGGWKVLTTVQWSNGSDAE